ncbi:hypothetical protein GCM10022278_33560 [Allohahella marinimesophila]|uniref:Uncharacterized protein n=1 Tax=Allohahella marinimesophila TaxID=1054972 RepID=A0ABP7PZ38_9GAMM
MCSGDRFSSLSLGPIRKQKLVVQEEPSQKLTRAGTLVCGKVWLITLDNSASDEDTNTPGNFESV